MTLKRRLQQIEAASIVTEGYQPMTAICRAIVGSDRQPSAWLFRGVGKSPDECTTNGTAAAEAFIASTGKPQSAFNVVVQSPFTAVRPALGSA